MLNIARLSMIQEFKITPYYQKGVSAFIQQVFCVGLECKINPVNRSSVDLVQNKLDAKIEANFNLTNKNKRLIETNRKYKLEIERLRNELR